MKIKLSKTKWEEMGKKAGWLKTSQLMSNYNYLDLGPTPNGENCAQVGNTIYDYYQLSKIENEAYAHQLMRMFPDMPAGLRIIRKSNPHDFGTYHELNLKWVDGDDIAEEFAYKIEGSSPENWDEEAKAELTAKGYFVELEKGKKKEEVRDNSNGYISDDASGEE